jgi:hypothetical protein
MDNSNFINKIKLNIKNANILLNSILESNSKNNKNIIKRLYLFIKEQKELLLSLY